MHSSHQKHFAPRWETNHLPEHSCQIEVLILVLKSCVLLLHFWRKVFLSDLKCRFDLFPHTVCFSKTLFSHCCRGVRFLEQKKHRKSMNSMLDCFVEINHVTPFGFISDQAAVSSQVSKKYSFTDEGSSFAPKIWRCNVVKHGCGAESAQADFRSTSKWNTHRIRQAAGF